eukprot:TRINITY_DN36476_c0_g2_i1.p1 TRINITY_DN36476_c0_g2~~TRINITY_DN36476_c0_g2_i1.p1  ORF type:complete len:263 (-),score=51.27 TRINITY_DN36476_c0_g2_i1:78-830(-)
MDQCELDPFALEGSGPMTEASAALVEVGQESFLRTVQALILIAANGYPRAIQSTFARRNRLLRQHSGHAEAAAEQVLDDEEGYAEEVKEYLLRLLPYIGVPATLIYPLWKQLRKTCLVASLFGHDLRHEAVRVQVLLASAGLQALPELEQAAEKAAERLWQKVAGRAAKLVPVASAVLALADLQSHAASLLLQHFRDGPGVLEYDAELDPEPALQDFLQLLRDVGQQSLEAVLEGSRNAPLEEFSRVYSS